MGHVSLATLLLGEICHLIRKTSYNITIYRTVGVVNRLEARFVTCDNAQLPMLSEPCSCWQVAASMGSMLDTAQCLETTATVLQMTT